MFCSNCGSKLDEDSKFCPSCGLATSNIESKTISKSPIINSSKKSPSMEPVPVITTSPTPKKPYPAWKTVLGVLIALGIVGAISNAFNQTPSNQEVGSMLKDSINGTNTAPSQDAAAVDLMKQVLVYFKTQYQTLLPDANNLNSQTFLTYDSFKSQADVEQTETTLNNLISEENNFENNFQKIVAGAENIISSSDLSSNDKQQNVQSFDQSLNNPQATQLRKNLIAALTAATTDESNLYTFLDNNFSDYEIKQDSNGEQNIAFYTDSNIKTYDHLMASIKSAQQNYQNAQSAYDANYTTALSQYGVSSSDVTNYFSK